MSHDANHAKEVAKQELQKLEQQIQEERKIRERELAERRQLVQAKIEMNQRMEQREKMRRDIVLEAQGDLSAQDEANLKKNVVTSVLHHALNESKLGEEADKVTSYEQAFRKIKDATGVSDVNEVIQKFLNQEDTHNNLVAMTKEGQSRIDALNEEKTMLKAQAEEAKYSGSGVQGGRHEVDKWESVLSDATAKMDRNRVKYERVAKVQINVKAGIEHLAEKLENVKIDAPPIAVSDDTIVDVLNQCEQKLLKMVESLQAQQEEDEIESPEAKNLSADEGDAQENAYNCRIKLPAGALDEDDSDEDYEEDLEEDVPDRGTMKKLSTMMLDKASKKTKKKKRRTMGATESGSSDRTRGTYSVGSKAQ